MLCWRLIVEEKLPENVPVDKQNVSQTPPASEEGIEHMGNKICPQCGTVNPSTALYCLKCGSKLPTVEVPNKKICIGCRTPNAPTSQYCYKCGLKLPEKQGTSHDFSRKYAGFWMRFLAHFIIDGIVLGIIVYVIAISVFPSISGEQFSLDTFVNRYTGEYTDDFWEFYFLTLFISLVVQTIYHTIAIGKWGKTIGKAALRLQVLKSDGSRVGYGRAFCRSMAYILNGLTLGIGFLIIAFNDQKRGLHDFICDTIVVRTDW